MCGIAGIIHSDLREVNVQRLKKMTDVIVHRGPDGEGQWVSDDGHTGLGHRRLSIIDLSVLAGQPMHYMNRYTIVFNGEIYNYIELKDSLLKDGFSFHTESDTEVLMALYHKHREKCVDQLDGMFAFAIYDNETKTLFCARDRFGEKPFHFCYEQGKYFMFASEMKSLWAAGVEKKVNNRMLYNYLQFGFVHNPANLTETFYSNIVRLEHAHYLVLDTVTLEMKIKRYFDIDLTKKSKLSLGDAASKMQDLFKVSVQRRLRSDVPVGSSLSGGLDSSLVVCIINEINKSIRQKTFSAQFPGFEKDETRYQNMVIDRVHAEAYATTPDEQTMMSELEKVFVHQEEPFGSSSIFVQYEVFRLAKEHNVTVLLDGQGADEFLAGYHPSFKYFFIELDKNKKEFGRQWDAYVRLHEANPMNDLFRRDAKYYLRKSLPFAFNTMKSIQNFMTIKRGEFSKEFYNTQRGSGYNYVSNFLTLNEYLKQEMFGGGLQTLLRYADRNSMAHSREVRLPFLNHELVEFIFSLPAEFKINEGWTKYIMRKAFENTLPADICWRKDKIGYEPPQKKWMGSAKMKDQIMHSRQTLVSNGILDPACLQTAINPGSAIERGDNSWAVLMAGRLLDL